MGGERLATASLSRGEDEWNGEQAVKSGGAGWLPWSGGKATWELENGAATGKCLCTKVFIK